LGHTAGRRLTTKEHVEETIAAGLAVDVTLTLLHHWCRGACCLGLHNSNERQSD
jgi:hypothetical protein